MTSTRALLLLGDQLRARHRGGGLSISGVGGCRKRAGFQLHGYEPDNAVNSVQAAIGSAVHQVVSEAVTALNRPGDLTEVTVEYAGLTGHVDRYEAATETLVDVKGLALDTPLPTPTGWTTMGEVQVGDTVFGRDGAPCLVTHKSDVKHLGCFRVVFDDATSIVCDEEHLWETARGESRTPKVEVLPVTTIRDTLRGRNGQRQHRIGNTQPLVGTKADLPVDPYVLGVWLGDGSVGSGLVTNPEPEIWSGIGERGYGLGVDVSRDNDKCEGRSVLGLMKKLRALGVLNNKHVPAPYLRASIDQRLELLRGLMDTDGTYHRVRKEASFTQKNRAIAEAVHELAVSLGECATISQVTRHGFGITGKYWYVVWRPRINPFLLPRKACLVQPPSAVCGRRMIVAVEAIEAVPTQCIAVDSRDRMYLAGRQMVPTHNTTSSYFLESIQIHGIPESHRFQTALYAAALIQSGVPVRTVRLDYLVRDSGQEWQAERHFAVREVRDALEWVKFVKESPFAALPRDYEPDGVICQGCPFLNQCWEGYVPDRDKRSVLLAEGAESAALAEELFLLRKQAKSMKDRMDELKGILDGLRPDDPFTVVKAGDLYIKWTSGDMAGKGQQLRFTTPPQKQETDV